MNTLKLCTIPTAVTVRHVFLVFFCSSKVGIWANVEVMVQLVSLSEPLS